MIFDAIRESHDLQRDLCRKLTASRRDMAARQVLFLQLKVELMAHAAAEERHVYVTCSPISSPREGAQFVARRRIGGVDEEVAIYR